MSLMLRRLLAAELVLLVVLALVWVFNREDRSRRQLEKTTLLWLSTLARQDDPTAFGTEYLREDTGDRLLAMVAIAAKAVQDRNEVQIQQHGLHRFLDKDNKFKTLYEQAKTQEMLKLLQDFDVKGLAEVDRKTREGRAKARGMLYSFLGQRYRLAYHNLRLEKATITSIQVTGEGYGQRAVVSFKTPSGRGRVAWTRRKSVGKRAGFWELDLWPRNPRKKPRKKKK